MAAVCHRVPSVCPLRGQVSLRLSPIFFFLILTKDVFSLLFRERKAERDRCERETSAGCLVARALMGDRTHNLGMCPDRESNP